MSEGLPEAARNPEETEPGGAVDVWPVEARLAQAQREGLIENLKRWLRFSDWQKGQWLEFQALPGKTDHGDRVRFAHGNERQDILRLLREGANFGATGLYVIANRFNDAVTTRQSRGVWHVVPKGGGITDRDIVARQVLFIDFDAVRSSGTSATEAEMAAVVPIARRVYEKLTDLLGGEEALALGHSGNGRQIFIALDAIPESPAVTEAIKGILQALSATYVAPGVAIDQKVFDARRLVPAFGTLKTKGAPGIPERPHRPTALVCADAVRRVTGEELQRLCEQLRAAAPAAPSTALTVAPRPSSPVSSPVADSEESPFARANAVPVADVAKWLGLIEGRDVRCPGCDNTDATLLDYGLKCHHNTCADKGHPKRPGFRSPVDLVVEVRGVGAWDAVKLMAEEFGFPLPESRARKRRKRGTSPARTDAANGNALAPTEDADGTLDAVVADGATGTGEPEPSPAARPRRQLPEIVVSDRQLRDVVDEAWQAVERYHRGDPRLFLREDRLVRVAFRKAGARIHELTETEVLDHISRVASWFRETKKGVVNTSPVRDVARIMFAKPIEELPELETVVSTPVFAPDGTLASRHGYHAGAQLWHHAQKGFEVAAVPEQPSPALVMAAKELLLEHLLVDFPFAAASDRAHAVAAFVLPFIRRMVEGCTPLHLVEAPSPGSGKGLLGTLVSIVAVGKAPAPTTLPQGDEEARKKITSILKKGQPIILIDNVKHGLDSAELAAAVTSETWSDRNLGESCMIELPNRATWIVTANNPRLSLEIARRCIRVRLDSQSDRPWERGVFKHDPIQEWAMEQRAALVHAILVLVQSWLAAGRPRGKRRLGSFESWAGVMGGILENAGIPGFLGDLDKLYEVADTEGQEWRAFCCAWWERHQSAWVPATDLLKLARERDLLGSAIGDKSEQSQKIRFGKALGAMRDRRFANWQVVVGRNSDGNAARYRLACDGAPDGERALGAAESPGASGDGRPSTLSLLAHDGYVEREVGSDDDDP
jgi:hypothetical protein